MLYQAFFILFRLFRIKLLQLFYFSMPKNFWNAINLNEISLLYCIPRCLPVVRMLFTHLVQHLQWLMVKVFGMTYTVAHLFFQFLHFANLTRINKSNEML